jgi:hypothetical protein
LKFNDESSQETLLTTIASVPLHGTDLLLHLNLGYLQYSDQTQSDNSVFKAQHWITRSMSGWGFLLKPIQV